MASAGRDQRGEPAAPGGTVGDQRGTTRRIGSAEQILDASIGTLGQPVRGDHRPQHVASEPLERGAVGGIDGRVGVKRESVDDRGAMSDRRLDALGPRVRQRHRKLHRLGLRLGELIDLVVDGRVGVATREQPRGPANDANGEHGDVLVSRRR